MYGIPANQYTKISIKKWTEDSIKHFVSVELRITVSLKDYTASLVIGEINKNHKVVTVHTD